MKKEYIGTLLIGVALGTALTGGAVAAGITAEPAWSPIYVDGRQVQMTAYNVAGNNYVKLRDIGKAVGFNVYFEGGVQVDSDAPYTGEAPLAGFQDRNSPGQQHEGRRAGCGREKLPPHQPCWNDLRRGLQQSGGRLAGAGRRILGRCGPGSRLRHDYRHKPH